MHGTTQRVLVVDDDPVLGAALVNQLKRIACRPRLASGHEQAIELFASDPQFDAILIGQRAVVGGAAQLVDAARSIRPGIRIIGYSVRDRRREFASAGVEEYLQLPSADSELIAALSLGEPIEERRASDTHFDHISDTAMLQFSRGQKVRVETGGMAGVTGIIVGKRSRGRLLLEIGVGVYLEIHQTCVSPQIPAA